MKHYNLIIKGRVQGVAFRASARDQARHLGIKGYVKNKPDGTVYIEAEGREDVLANFIAWCRKGPSMAFVENVEIEADTVKAFRSFEIKR